MDNTDTHYGTRPPHQAQTGQVKRGRGCLFYGVIAFVLIALFIVGAFAFVAYAGIKTFVSQYGSEEQLLQPEVELSSEERAAAVERIERFRTELKAGKAAEPLQLKGAEVDALLSVLEAEDGSTSEIGKFIGLTAKGDLLEVDASVPFSALLGDWSIFRGRYLNLTSELFLEVKEGAVTVSPRSFSIKSPSGTMNLSNELKQVNFAENLESDPQIRKFIERLHSVRIENGVLIIESAL